MSSTGFSALTGFSDQLISLVERATPGVAAVKAAPYRVVSAVAIAADLLIVTDHTLKREGRIGVVLPSGREIAASLVGRAPGLDLALLRVEEAVLTPLAESSLPAKPGALIAAVGFTADVGPSVSLGILGAVGGERRTWRRGVLDQFLRLDVNLYPSQAGAAVVGMDGGLIGLATPALLRHSAVAVPHKTLQRISEELQKHGRVSRGYLGVGLQPVAIPQNLRDKAGLSAKTGLMLLSVESGSPAEEGGLQLGDILVSLGSASTWDPDDLQDLLLGNVVGEIQEAVLIRGGELIRKSVRIGERPTATRKEN